MIYFIEGIIEELSPTFVVINCHGVGYQLQVSVRTAEMFKVQDKVKVLTQLVVREDAHILYGFHSAEERDCFNMLVTVSGIGVNTARVILSTVSAQEVVNAILYDDETTFKKVKGVGAKTAKRIILDLKDKAGKLKLESKIDLESESENNLDDGKKMYLYKNEALNALTVLGFSGLQANKVLDSILKNDSFTSVEDLIKKALAKL
jgi:Holliday junction DNA helicase RuvA